MPASPAESLEISRLARAYSSGAQTPLSVVEAILQRIDERGDDKVWIHRPACEAILERAHFLTSLDADKRKTLPLYGIPFAVKDNIDVAGQPTTAACPAYAYEASEDAYVVRLLTDAGAILIGKTNLDQFATGLVGTRTPFGPCPNAFDPAYISGGSSAGSAVAVAAGLVSFALGTDTAGSGRVPAALNNIVGLKPTRGLLSTRGVVPACRTLDCVSIFALTALDAQAVLSVASQHDPDEPYSRQSPTSDSMVVPRADLDGISLAVPRDEDLEFFRDEQAATLYQQAVASVERMGAKVEPIDFGPFTEAALLLYEGPWVAERYLVVRDLLERDPEALHPATRAIVETSAKHSAADAFAAQYRIADLRRQAEQILAGKDALLIPTTPTIYTIAELEKDPIRLNSNLGIYTNFLNLFDMAGVAVPAGLRIGGLPFGVTLAGPAFSDSSLLELGDAMHRAAAVPLGATGIAMTDSIAPAQKAIARAADPSRMRIAVCGAHMRGLALSGQLLALDGRFEEEARTSGDYRLYAFEAMDPPRPGLVRMPSSTGAGIALEIWSLPLSHIGALLQQIAPPLGLGTIGLSTGERVQGFLCEAYATTNARDITEFESWRNYLAAGAAADLAAVP